MNAQHMIKAVRLIVTAAIEDGDYQPWNRPWQPRLWADHGGVDVETVHYHHPERVVLLVASTLGMFVLCHQIDPNDQEVTR